MVSRVLAATLVMSSGLLVSHAGAEERLLGPIVNPSQATGPAYPLDGVTRDIPEGPFRCPKFETKRYLGTNIRYSSPIFVHAAFAEKLVVFDALVRKIGVEVYGRAPTELHHLGGTHCEVTASRHFGEHAFGNAIDVDRFVFAALGPGEKLPEGMPAALAKEQTVALSWHYFSTSEVGKYHARFLNRLAIALKNDGTLFRTVLGPGYGDHWNHFHLDVAPTRFVSVIVSKDAAR